ncbi:MAG: hypothetical protein ABI628_11630 [Chloroflexota bacterium]
MGLPAFVLIAIVVLQVAGGAARLPLVRRWAGRSSAPWASHRRQP